MYLFKVAPINDLDLGFDWKQPCLFGNLRSYSMDFIVATETIRNELLIFSPLIRDYEICFSKFNSSRRRSCGSTQENNTIPRYELSF